MRSSALTRATTVVIADESAEMRTLLAHTLREDRRFLVVGQAATAGEAAALVVRHSAAAIVLDPSLPLGSASDDPVTTVRAASPAVRIVVLTGYDSEWTPSEAMARGAHAFLEKGVPHSELLSVLASLCPPPPRSTERMVTAPVVPPAGSSEGSVVDAGSPHRSDPADAARRDPLLDLQPMRRARWVGAVLALVQFWLYPPPDGLQTPLPQLATGVFVAATLAVLNLAGLAIGRRAARAGADAVAAAGRRLGWVGLAVDTALVLGIVWFFTFDTTSALWALLVLPVMEGALVAELRGALGTWAVCTVGYVAREMWGAAHYGNPFLVDSQTYRNGVVLIVAVTIGQLARRARDGVEAEQEARAEADRRAGLLRDVAASSRRISSLTGGDVVGSIVDAAVGLGFDAAEICVYDESEGTWSVRSLHGVPYAETVQPIDSGIAGVVHRTRETVVLDDYSGWEGALSEVATFGFHAAVAAPIWSAGELRGTLIAARFAPSPVLPSEVEAVELLGAQAGVAFGNIRLLEQIRHQALHDALTGLPNQTLFEDRVAQGIARSARDGSRLALLFCDLDRFKKVNDSLGHEAGNELLKQVAGRMLASVRPTDTVARMGGDEFTVLVPSVADADEAVATAQRLIQELRRPFVLGGLELVVTPSIGIAMHPADGPYETMLRHADLAMYRAKQRGGNRVEVFRPGLSTAPNHTDLSLEAELFAAVEQERLRVLYQPVVALADERLVGVEALVRWEHGERGLLAPEEFLPIAEEAGLIVRIDTWVLEQALAQLRSWHADGCDRLRVAVNLSARQFFQPQSVEAVTSTIRSSGVDPRFVDLEVTEALASDEILDALPLIDKLRALGVGIAIDDFGTGYSMLARLRQLPLDKLKIDKSFVAEIDAGSADAPIVAATVAMAKSLGLTVIAEGVERRDQADYLRAAGCDWAQGYLYGRPQDAAGIRSLLVRPR